jgi:hypothetical protein
VTAPDPIAEALVALVRKYPAALQIPDAVARVAATTGIDRVMDPWRAADDCAVLIRAQPPRDA